MSTLAAEAATFAAHSPSQRRAIEAEPGPMLVLAGPGAGKTYCLIERIAYLIERLEYAPERICAFTFTNKAAGEIATRLRGRLGGRADDISASTIHAFCAKVLREFGNLVGLPSDFGVADEAYQSTVLRRLKVGQRYHKATLNRFAAHRLRNDPISHRDIELLHRYEQMLLRRHMVDFDDLLIRAAELVEEALDARAVPRRWDVVLVDEFQDLNPVQYRLLRALVVEHHHVFAVGDHDQSIYSWAGADPRVFRKFLNDFALNEAIQLEDNRRCPATIYSSARRLVVLNPSIFSHRAPPPLGARDDLPILVHCFDDDEAEAAWVVGDLRDDRSIHGHGWEAVALLYRKHQIGERLEAALIEAGIPCRLASGHALSDDKVAAFALTALRAMIRPRDTVASDEFFRHLLPEPLYDAAQARAAARNGPLLEELRLMGRRLPRGDPTGKQVRRALVEWRNLAAVKAQHTTLDALVRSLLSKRVGSVQSVLDQHHAEISDPMEHPEVVSLASKLNAARLTGRGVWIAAPGGADIAMSGILALLRFGHVCRGGAPPPDAESLQPTDAPHLGLPLTLFKAAQLIEMQGATNVLTAFTAVDIETTSKDVAHTEVVELAAVRVRDGVVVDRFVSLIRPTGLIGAGAAALHGIRDADVMNAESFVDVWPRFHAFCGKDLVVAHNGHAFDFPILRRLARQHQLSYDLCQYDSLPLARELCESSCTLANLARRFGVELGRSHRAADDANTLALVLVALGELKRSRDRKTALVSALDHLGVALALSDQEALCGEARRFREYAQAYALGRYSTCLEWYEREQRGDDSVPSVDEVIERLGGRAVMLRLRKELTPEQRYPAAMRRLRRVIDDLPDRSLEEQIDLLLERVALSKFDGLEDEMGRVNLLTLHSTKGLEFSRVYIVGVEDAELPGSSGGEPVTAEGLEEARRLLYVGMTRTKQRLVMTRAAVRNGTMTGGQQFLDEMGLAAVAAP